MRVVQRNNKYLEVRVRVVLHASRLGLPDFWDKSRTCSGWPALAEPAPEKPVTKRRLLGLEGMRVQDFAPLEHPRLLTPIQVLSTGALEIRVSVRAALLEPKPRGFCVREGTCLYQPSWYCPQKPWKFECRCVQHYSNPGHKGFVSARGHASTN